MGGFRTWTASRSGDGAVLSLSQEMESAGNPVGAVGWLRRAREWAVYDELVLRRQVELLLALGDRSGAVREYESFARRLSVDLGMEPSEEVQSLLDRPPGAGNTWANASTGSLELPPAFRHPVPIRISAQIGEKILSSPHTVGIASLLGLSVWDLRCPFQGFGLG